MLQAKNFNFSDNNFRYYSEDACMYPNNPNCREDILGQKGLAQGEVKTGWKNPELGSVEETFCRGMVNAMSCAEDNRHPLVKVFEERQKYFEDFEHPLLQELEEEAGRHRSQGEVTVYKGRL